MGQHRQTRIQRSTVSPIFNESFFFNLNEAPSRLMDELIAFEVFNSRMLRRDAFVGSFRLEVGLAYEQEGHCFMRKWLMLSNPTDSSGVSGYLKVRFVVERRL